MESFTVSAREPYHVYIGKEILGSLPERLEDSLPVRNGHRPMVFTVTDRNVSRHYLKTVIGGLERRGFRTARMVLPPGEGTKSFRSLQDLLGRMVRAGLGRDDVLVGLGGGVIGDLAGFAASVYMRGCAHVEVPTTLLSQVDSSVGGKTGINIKEGKNLVGSFKSPLFVLMDTETLRTLDGRQWVCGLAEIIKCGLIRERTLFETVERFVEGAKSDHTITGDRLKTVLCSSWDLLHEIIVRAVRIKQEIVAEDENEEDLRRLLNFGHTFGHALETLLGYRKILHGEAVILGMRIAATLSQGLELLSLQDGERINRLLELLHVPGLKRISVRQIYNQIGRDKKKRGGKIHYVLLEQIGKAAVRSDIDRRAVMRSMTSVIYR
jgi:3-dehydroquinate synthase